MALHLKTFQTRALTAVIFVLVMLAGLLISKWSFFLLFSIVHFGAWTEYQKLVKLFNPGYQKISALHRYGIMAGGWCLLLFFTQYELAVFGIALSDIGLWLGLIFAILLPVIMYLESKLVFLGNLGYSLFGLIYISLSLGLMMDIRMHPTEVYLSEMSFSLYLVLFIIVSIWINDTMAYIVGSLIGKTPLSSISPKKTWEGTAGGAALCIVVMSVIGRSTGFDLVHSIFLSAITAVSGTFGDLFESKLKRMAGVKDSGSLMPGHGGFLDRFDSLLFAVVFAWFYISIFIW